MCVQGMTTLYTQTSNDTSQDSEGSAEGILYKADL